MTALIRLALVLAATVLIAGCGSIHVGDTEHIHIYPEQMIQGDDAQLNALAKWVQTIRANANQEEPLDGFRWNEAEIARGVKEGEAL